MKFNIPEGITLASQMTVTHDHLASFPLGKIEVLSTLSILKFMEDTCKALLQNQLPEGYDTVSAEMNVRHIAPVKEHQTIYCNVLLKFVDDRRLFFDFVIMDEERNEIALGGQKRHIVNITEFNNSI